METKGVLNGAYFQGFRFKNIAVKYFVFIKYVTFTDFVKFSCGNRLLSLCSG